MVNLKERRRKVDLNSLPTEDFQQLVKMIGEKLKNICDKATEDANIIANTYGFEVKLQFLVQPANEE